MPDPLHPLCSPVVTRAEQLAVDIGRLMAVATTHDLDTWQLEDSLHALRELTNRVDALSFSLSRKVAS